MSIHQFNAIYDKQEDRILFRFNTSNGEEYRFWLTRFISLKLIESVDQLVQKTIESKHDARIAQVVQEFQQDAVKKTTNLKEQYKPVNTFPMGDKPLLVTGFTLKLNNDLYNFTLQLQDKKSLTFNLPDKNSQSLVLLLRKICDELAFWGSHPSSTSPSKIEMSEPPSSSSKLH